MLLKYSYEQFAIPLSFNANALQVFYYQVACHRECLLEQLDW